MPQTRLNPADNEFIMKMSEAFLFDVGVIVFPTRPGSDKPNLPGFSIIIEHMIDEGAIVIRVNRSPGEGRSLFELLESNEDSSLASTHHDFPFP